MSFRRSKIPKFIPIISLLILLVLGPIVFSFLQNAGKVEAAWVDDNFSYRNAIPITSHTAAENNVYISATIDTSASGQFQSDCGDLRFTTVGGDILPYYIVSGCVSASTVVHVFFKSMPAGAQTIYYYYGNPSAANGFSSADFATQATAYALGSVASQEKGGAPIAYWKFDDGTGTNTQDSSPNNNDGTITGATWQSEDQCISGKCLFFDGTNDDVVTISDNNMLDFGTDSFTVSGWALHNDYTYPKSNFMIKKSPTCYGSGAANAGFDIGHGYYASGINICLHDNLDNRVYTNVTFDSGYRPSELINKWTYYVFVFNRTTGKVYTFINGVKQSSELDISSVTGSINNSSSLSIGTLYGWRTHGKIDDVKIYNYARTAAQIKSDFKSRGTAKGSSASLGSKISDLGSLSNGLVGYWKMDESSGTLADASGNSNTGTWAGTGGSHYTSGKFGNGGGFGTDDTVAISHNSVLKPSSQITISAWVKPTNITTNTYYEIYRKEDGSDRHLLSFQDNGTILSFGLGTATQGYQELDVSITASNYTDGWHFITATYDGQNKYLYRDGVQIGTQVATGAIGTTGTANAYIGSFANASEFFVGSIDEVRIYNRALSPREVRDLYNWAPGPILQYQFDEKSGGSANDTSGYGNNGTLNGTATWKNGKYGSGLSTDGSSTFVSKSSASSFDFDGRDFTVEAWIKPIAAVGDVEAGIVCLSSGSNGTTTWCLVTDNDDYVFYTDTDGGWGPTDSASTTDDVTTDWAHIVGVYTSGSSLKIYKNGILIASDTSISSDLYNPATPIIWVGRGPNHGYFNGVIDDVRIYNYARTQKQIVEDMNAGHPVGGSPVGSQIGYWRFDEGYSTTVNNSGTLGSSGNGTMINSPVWSQSGKFGKAINYSQSNDYVTLGGNSNFVYSEGEEWTSTLWFKTSTSVTGINGGVTLLSKGTGNAIGGYSIGIGQLNSQGYDNKIHFVIDKAPGNNYAVSTNSLPTVNDGNWHYVAVVYDAKNNTNVGARIYFDGVNYGYVASGVAKASWATTSSYPLTAGAMSSAPGTSQNFTGLVDEIKLYSSALTEDEIKLDYNRGQAMVLGTLSDTSGLTGGSVASSSASAEYCIPGDTATCSPPVARWDFEEKSGANAYDTSGNGNTGTLTLGPTWTIGKHGTAVNLDGNNDYIGLTSSINMTTGNYTVSAWLNVTALPSVRSCVVGNYWFCYDNTGHLTHWNGTSWLPSTNTISTGIWTHVTQLINSDGTIRYFINGVQDPSTNTGADTAITTSTIGAHSSGAYFINGKIDQVRIYNYARTQAQIAYDYNRGAPVGHWRMDECQGATAKDSSGNGNTGTITIGATGTQTAVGTCTTSGTAWYNGVTGKFNSSLNFDGTDDYVNNADNDIYSFGNGTTDRPFSASAWIKTNTTASQGIVTKYGSGGADTKEWVLYLTSSNYPGFYVQDNSASAYRGRSYNSALSTGTWYHVVGVYDGGGLTSSSKIYVNGKQVDDTDITTGTYTAMENGTAPLSIGITRISDLASPFNGQIDDVRIYNYALTASQVKNLFNGGAGIRFGPTTGSP